MALRRPEHPARVALVAVVVLIVVNLAVYGTRNEVRGTAAPQRPTAITLLSPGENEIVLAQSAIIVDLRPGNTAQLAIDGHIIPQDQLSIEPNLYELSFQPTSDHDIHQFSPGPHAATVQWWPRTRTYEQAKAERLLSGYTWSFKVS